MKNSSPDKRPMKISLRRIGWIVAIAVLIYFYSGTRSFARDVNPAPARIDWNTALQQFRVDNDQFVGQRFLFYCPEYTVRDKDETLYGTDTYPSESPLCVAAVHAGVINRYGGSILVQLNPGPESYIGSVRNKAASHDFPKTLRSIVFIDSRLENVLDQKQRDYAPRLRWNTRFTRTGLANRDLIGQRFVFKCPAAPSRLKGQGVSGTDRYAFNSFVCLAAVHAGRLTLKGGFVAVQIIEADSPLKGSIRNGIASKGGGAGSRQLIFVANKASAVVQP